MGYEFLSFTGFANEMHEVSFGPHPRKFCFVIGAGASKSSGIKTGQELVEIWDKELFLRNSERHQQWKTRMGITDDNKGSFYSQYYSRRFEKAHEDGYNYMEKLMEHAKPSVGYVMLAYLLTKTPHNVVITTNFDHLIEDAVTYYSQVIPFVIGHESLAHYIRKPLIRPTIVKIHRDLLLDPRNQAEEVEKLHNSWETPLDIIFSEYHPIFIGYAGNDNSLMDFLVENGENFQSKKWKFPYWMLYGSDALAGKVETFMNASNGYVVKHDGFDKSLYLIGSIFDYKVPTKEKFMDDPEKRYQALSDSINKFTKEQSDEPETPPKGGPEPADGDSEINKAIQQITDQSELLRMYRMSVMLHNMGKYKEALEISDKLVKLEPDNARYQDGLGVTLHEMGRFDEALVAAQKAVELEPDNARYQDSFGVTLHEMGRFDEALVAKQKAVDLEPDNALYQYSLGVTLCEMGRFNEALVATQKAVELEPDNALYQNNLGVTLHEMRRFDEALVSAQKAVKLEPDNARYQDSLGVTLHEMGRFNEALIAKQNAVKFEPDNARYQDSLGVTLCEMGRFDEALIANQKAVELEPDNPLYQNNLGATLHKMGRFNEALIAKQKAVELEPDNVLYQNSLSFTLHKMD